MRAKLDLIIFCTILPTLIHSKPNVSNNWKPNVSNPELLIAMFILVIMCVF